MNSAKASTTAEIAVVTRKTRRPVLRAKETESYKATPASNGVTRGKMRDKAANPVRTTLPLIRRLILYCASLIHAHYPLSAEATRLGVGLADAIGIEPLLKAGGGVLHVHTTTAENEEMLGDAAPLPAGV